MSRLLYLQSGGPSAVLNTSAQGALETARARGVGGCAAADGLAGLLAGRIYDISRASAADVAQLGNLPGAAFGSSRHILPAYHVAPQQWEQLAGVLRRFDIRYLLLNGGNGSMTTAQRLAELAERFDLPLTAVGVPKTIDNDLEGCDFSPGFPSAAKYLAASLREVITDMRSMGGGRVFVMETMGRHVGWLAAACALAAGDDEPAPLLLLPERAYDEDKLFAAVKERMARHGHCALVVSEGLRDAAGHFVSQMRESQTYGHEQLGGAGVWLGERLQTLGLHAHVAVVDCLQRAARHMLSGVDARLAYRVGAEAADWALSGRGGVMAAIHRRLRDDSVDWDVVPMALAEVADKERELPDAFIGADGLSVTPAFHDYLRPLLQGEVAQPWVDGLPDLRVPRWTLLE